MKRLRTLTIALTTAFLLVALAPERARALSKTETTIVIVASVVGGLAVVALVATLIMRQDKKIFRLDPVPGEPGADPLAPKSGMRFALDCPTTADGRPLVCW
jgi:hypothetical protein